MEKQEPDVRSLRGFAAMNKELQRDIARRGGQATHERGRAHKFNSSEAILAAKKGHIGGTAHEFTSAEARVAGLKGLQSRAMNRAAALEPSTASAGEAVMAFAQPAKE